MRGNERTHQRQTRVEARLEHHHDVGNQQSAVLRSRRKRTITITRAITVLRNTFSRQLPTAIRRIDPATSGITGEGQNPPNRRRNILKLDQLAALFRYCVMQ